MVHGVKAFLPYLQRRTSAHIVNVASSGVFVPFPTNGPYSIAKAGVAALSGTLVAELPGTQRLITSGWRRVDTGRSGAAP